MFLVLELIGVDIILRLSILSLFSFLQPEPRVFWMLTGSDTLIYQTCMWVGIPFVPHNFNINVEFFLLIKNEVSS